MVAKWHPRSVTHRTISKEVFFGIVAIFALLAARNVPPDFPPVSSHDFSIRAVSSHDHRPHFDFNGLQWTAPVSVFLPLPPVAMSSRLAAVSQLVSTIQTKGFHYNRPPPIC
jgi:hypothetical protein